MIKFVNAKINLGLNIVAKRDDGYHDLETVFFPVGLESGMPQQPEAFDDILEIVNDTKGMSGCRFQLMGRRINCMPNNNLVVKATTRFMKSFVESGNDIERLGMFEIILDKHLPEGAGLGGGSADATFTLIALNEHTGGKLSKDELKKLALELGSDCPFFIENTPCFAEGRGEKLTPIKLDLKGTHLLIVKPQVYISTKEAFERITPRKPDFDLRLLPDLPLDQWKGKVVNDFEKSIFPKYPELEALRDLMYDTGADYASMSGSGSAIYALFKDGDKAFATRDLLKSTYEEVWLFGI